MEKRAKHKQKWNESKVIEKHFYNKALQKRALWLADMLVPFARRLHADAGALGISWWDVKLNTKEKFHFYKQPCFTLFIT